MLSVACSLYSCAKLGKVCPATGGGTNKKQCALIVPASAFSFAHQAVGKGPNVKTRRAFREALRRVALPLQVTGVCNLRAIRRERGRVHHNIGDALSSRVSKRSSCVVKASFGPLEGRCHDGICVPCVCHVVCPAFDITKPFSVPCALFRCASVQSQGRLVLDGTSCF